MLGSREHIESHYEECFEDELRFLSRRRKQDASFTPEVLEGTLKALYQIDGDNWEGRSSVAQEQLDAQIDAAEKFLHEWRAELERKDRRCDTAQDVDIKDGL